MTQDEIRKLLGGYATDALTADERRMLFEAALEDQELFSALENEDALKELLEDPVTRAQVHTALQARRPRFWSRRWMYGVAIPAVLAVIVIAVMNRANAPRPISQSPAAAPPQIVARQVAPKIEEAPQPKVTPQPQIAPQRQIAPQPQIKKQTTASEASPAPPAPAPPRLQLQSAGAARPNLAAPVAVPMMAALRAAPPPIPDAVRQQLSSMVVTTAPLYQGPLVQYSLVRSDQAVRVDVTAGIAGYLALYEIDASGNSKHVYPPGNDVAARVSPNLPMQIPSEPLKLADGAKLRLVLVPAPPGAVNGFLGGAVGGIAKDAVSAPQGPLTPLVVDIPVAPN
jgi:Domain of unknown function (DUF4384)